MTITLSIEKKETTQLEVELPVPCFFKNASGFEYVGLLDEKTVVEIISDEYEKSIRNFDASKFTYAIERVKNAYQGYHACTETEFLDKYAEVEKSMSLHPILIP